LPRSLHCMAGAPYCGAKEKTGHFGRDDRVRRRKEKRKTRGHDVSCPYRLGLLDGAYGEAGDEAIEEEVVEEGYGETGDQAGGHEGAPVVDVAAD